MFAARGGWAAIIRPVKRGVGDAAPYMQGEVYYNFVVCNAVRPYRLFYCYAWPWIAVTGSIVIGGEALLLLLLLHRCKKREEDD